MMILPVAMKRLLAGMLTLLVPAVLAAALNNTLLYEANKITTEPSRLNRPVPSPGGGKLLFTTEKGDKLWYAEVNPKQPPVLITSQAGCGLNSQWLDDQTILYLVSAEDQSKRAAYTVITYDCGTKISVPVSSSAYDKNNPVVVDGSVITPTAVKTIQPLSSLNQEVGKLLHTLFPFLAQSVPDKNHPAPNVLFQVPDQPVKTLPYIIYYLDRVTLMQYNRQTDKRTVIAERVYDFNLSPDRQKIVYVTGDDILVKDLTTGPGEPGTVSMLDSGNQPVWVNNTTIIFIKSLDNGHNIIATDIYLKRIGSPAGPGSRDDAINLTNSTVELEYTPAYDPNLKRIYFSSLRDGNIHYFDFEYH